MSVISGSVYRRATIGLKIVHQDVKVPLRSFLVTRRMFVSLPEVYSEDKDPRPYFFSPNVQKLLKHITRPDYPKIFRRRVNKGDERLSTPKYKFMTAEELEIALLSASKRGEKLLAMPPVLKVRNEVDSIISKDPALTDHSTATYVFTDITFGIPDNERLITVRESDGTLRHAEHDTRQKMNQIYFPRFGRKLRTPMMFTDMELLKDLLEKLEYEFILDRACLQFEPEDEKYQRTTSQTYQHCNNTKQFEVLRSTRHFGPMAFYLAWHNHIDNLMLDIIQTGAAEEAVSLIKLVTMLHPNKITSDTANELSAKVLARMKRSLIIEKQARVLDFALEENCLKCAEDFIKKYATNQGTLELALQTARESLSQKKELQKGLEVAHGKL